MKKRRTMNGGSPAKNERVIEMQAKENKNRFLGTELIRAVEREDTARVKLLLKIGANPDSEIERKGINYPKPGTEYLRPLSAAFYQYNTKMISLLLDYGADVDFEMEDGQFFVNSVMESRGLDSKENYSLIKSIVYRSKKSKTSHIREKSISGISPATLAAKTGRIEIYKDFIKRGAVFGPTDLYYLSWGRRTGCSELEKMAAIRMLRQGCLEHQFETEMHPLECAAEDICNDMLRILLEYGANTDILDPDRISLFEGFSNIERFNSDKFLILMKHGYDIKKHQAKLFEKALFYGCTRKGIEHVKEAFKCFVDCGAEIKAAERVFREYYSKGVPKQFKELWKFARSLRNPKQMSFDFDNTRKRFD